MLQGAGQQHHEKVAGSNPFLVCCVFLLAAFHVPAAILYERGLPCREKPFKRFFRTKHGPGVGSRDVVAGYIDLLR